jgi:hypothetical protein
MNLEGIVKARAAWFRIARLTCDHVAIDGDRSPAVQALIRTLFDILALRKGPDAIPHSVLLLSITVVMWFLPLFFGTQLLPALDAQAILSITVSWLVSLACYVLVFLAAGRSARLVQAMTAIVGCGALISFGQISSVVFLGPFLSETLVAIVVELLLFWSVYVKGHIAARTLEREWYVGLIIAIGVFLLQYASSSALLGAS